ncbi:Flp pilus assembly protein CpaB [Acidithiobacillus sp. AMEEHan]|uniref:Flp pilus assembly protein CpaB n=1 Tax=Acidithiobacillus sp. AMEEHan TaxID=2994951 RepID=UPI0027E450FA|nr:Flp pilus assembly protein CpaB [Acidithiobacillus sp. AMEEHan]
MAAQLPEDLEPITIQKKPARTLGGWLLLAAAILAGLAAAYLAVHTLRSREEAAIESLRSAQRGETIRAVVPIHDIVPGTILDLSMVAARSIPANTAPTDVITPEDFEKFAGHRVNVPLQQGRPILASYLSTRRTLADIIDPDKLAMTFTVDNTSTLDGMLQPGDHVDVLWFSTAGQKGSAGEAGSGVTGEDGAQELQKALGAGASGGPVMFQVGTSPEKLPKESVRYLERDLKILATGTRTVSADSAANLGNDPAMQGAANQFNSVTVELTPLQIQKLALAKRLGELQLVLRSHDSQVVAPAKVFTVRDILGVRKHAGGTLYAADTIEYIVGSTGESGQLRSHVDLANLRRLPKSAGDTAEQSLAAGGGALPKPVPLDQLLPPVSR